MITIKSYALLSIDTTGLWDFTDLGPPKPPKLLKPATARFIEFDESMGAAKDLIASLVKVGYYMPCRIDGFPKSRVSHVMCGDESLFSKGKVVTVQCLLPSHIETRRWSSSRCQKRFNCCLSFRHSFHNGRLIYYFRRFHHRPWTCGISSSDA